MPGLLKITFYNLIFYINSICFFRFDIIFTQDWFYGDAINAKNCEKCTCDPQVGDLKDLEGKI